MKSHSHWELLGQFVAHIFLGVCMFTITLLGGAATKYVLVFFAPVLGHASHEALELLEHVFLWADVAFLAWWCVYSTFKACKALCDE